ncbi:efflux RND transporter periplasmic adaptor subunit [Acidobacteria bacterium AH-259-G07]|nr:efflux RND transporter periplasmic adaptor subunit [Acidobacteria bacterium AH-259-G07]
MSPGQTKLRNDLVVSQQETAEGTSFVVKDPATERFFRFREVEHFIAQQLDGSTPFDVIRQRAEEKFGAPLTQDTLEQFIEKLRRLGLLETEGAEFGHQKHRRGRIRGHPLYLRLKAFDPDRLFDRLIHKVRFFFTSYFLAFSAVAILLAFVITLSNWEEIGRDLLSLYRLQALLLAWLTILLVTTAHEFAHGLTCKHYGGEVHEMGFMLLFFMPAFYCNVSDAWLFPERSKRLWVTFAGAYFEIFLWGLATVIWRVTEPGTWVNSLALVVMATSGIKTLFNLNPLIKLDGYYLLSDYLEVPNLRQRAFSYVGAGIKRLWGRAMQGMQEATPRERRIYLTYGLLAGAYSFLLLGFIALKFGGFLIGRYQGLGFLLFTVLLMTIFRKPLKKAFSKPPALRKMVTSMKGRPAKITVLAAVLALLLLGRMELKVSGEFTVLPTQNADVRAEVEGIIEEVHVDEGDLVKEGHLIARLSDRDYRVEFQKIQAEIHEKRAKLKMLKMGPRREEIELARNEVETAKTRQEHAWKRYDEAKRMHVERLPGAEATVEKAEERLSYARDYLDMFKDLLEAKAISRLEIRKAEEQIVVREKELEEARAELEILLADDLAEVREVLAVAEKELEEAEGRLTILLAGSRPEEIKATEAEIARLEAQRRYLEGQLKLVRVLSPSSGVITTPKLKEKIGQHVKKGDLIAEVHELKTIRAEIPISEKEIADVKVGQMVVLKARAYPKKSFHGKVTSIAPMARAEDEGRGGRTILVTTELDNPSLFLKSEMTGNAKIYCGKRRIFDLMTRGFTRYIRVEFWSWW